MYRMLYPLSIWSVFILLNVLKCTCAVAVFGRESKNNLHQHMTKREIEYYFGVKDPSEIPEYEVRAPHQTEANGRAVSRFRRRRSTGHPDVLHYKLHAFGSKLQLRLKRNLNLMSPNFVIERHHGGGIVTTEPAPRNKYYLGKVLSDPDSLVALRSDKGLSGMIRTSSDLFFVQPLPAHLAKRVRRSADYAPHLICRLSPGKADARGCETKISGDDRLNRSTHQRTTRDASSSTVSYKYLEAALIVPKSYEEKYRSEKFPTILLVIANMVASMYQDPSIGDIKVYYVLTKIIVLNSTEEEAGFSARDSNAKKLTKMLRWARPSIQLPDNDTEHYDVFSYVSNKIPVGGLAPPRSMCKSGSNGNVQADLGIQTALHIAHEIGHNFGLAHDSNVGCNSNAFIMAASLPGGVYAATWSNCSRVYLQEFLKNDARSWCLKDPPTLTPLPALLPQDQGKLPGEIFNGNDQCEMQYGNGWRMSPYQKGVCGSLYCFKGGTQLSRVAPVADGSQCGVRSWCIGGKCEDNGRPRIHGKWSPWSDLYSSCTRNCSGGVQYRTRLCTNPAPSNGGSPCKGSNQEWRVCNPQTCTNTNHTFRKEQCLQKNRPAAHYVKSRPCALWCKSGLTAVGYGAVKDGTRCTSGESPINLDVCIQGSCQPVGCDHVLNSDTVPDRCKKCGGDGDTCFVVSSNYSASHKLKGVEQADLIVRLPVGAYSVHFSMRKSSNNYIGVQTDNGTHLVGGRRSSKVQTVNAANTKIQYTRKRGKLQDNLLIPGPTNAFLRVVYVYVKGENPGVDYNFIRPVKSSETPPKRIFEWVLTNWTGCSATCGKGIRTRSARCKRSDDKTPASNRACGIKPSTREDCNTKDCPSAWHVTSWTDCSRSCGRGVQTRDVRCLMKITANEYVAGTNCSANNKPNITNLLKYCNSIPCDSDWDTEDGFVRGQCGEPFEPDELKCYHRDQFGERARIPDIVCRYREKPIRLPCTTLPPPTTRIFTERETDITKKPTKKSQSIQAQSSMFVAFLIPVLQILLENFIFP